MPPGDDHIRREAAVEPEHYTEDSYDTLRRFVSYWHQIDVIRSAEPDRVLEIGVGNGFVSNYLRHRGLDVVTLDVNPMLGPDVLGSISDIPFSDDSFDVVCACEVLEHLPQELVNDSLREMRPTSRKVVLLSVPNRTVVYPQQITIPKVGPLRWLLPRGIKPREERYFAHHWQIGHDGVSAKDVRRWMVEAGLEVERDWRPFDNPSHHFFYATIK